VAAGRYLFFPAVILDIVNELLGMFHPHAIANALDSRIIPLAFIRK